MKGEHLLFLVYSLLIAAGFILVSMAEKKDRPTAETNPDTVTEKAEARVGDSVLSTNKPCARSTPAARDAEKVLETSKMDQANNPDRSYLGRKVNLYTTERAKER